MTTDQTIMDKEDHMADEQIHDNGPWTVSVDGKTIMSEDFTHDVELKVTGDFYNDAQRHAYSQNLAKKLNSALINN